MKNLNLTYDGFYFYLNYNDESLIKCEDPVNIMEKFECLAVRMNLKSEVLI